MLANNSLLFSQLTAVYSMFRMAKCWGRALQDGRLLSALYARFSCHAIVVVVVVVVVAAAAAVAVVAAVAAAVVAVVAAVLAAAAVVAAAAAAAVVLLTARSLGNRYSIV